MRNQKTLHIASHLGGGAGKAITGIATCGNTIAILEKPQKEFWLERAKAKGGDVIIEPSAAEMEHLIKEADITVINWWGHPKMLQFLAGFPSLPCRLVLYSHVNGCVYPYLPFQFINAFDAVMFTTPYSYENPLWTEEEREVVKQKSAVVYGMGEYAPEEYIPKASYEMRDQFVVGYIGTLNYAKLNPRFVEYCEAVADRINNIKFLLVGDLDEEVKADIANSRIRELFECVGYAENTEDYYKSFDVLGYLLNDYNFATTENVLLEAMAYGVPIVALNQGVERHIIYNGKNGYLVNGKEEYTEILSGLYASQEKRKRIGRAAREWCMEMYSVGRNRATYEELICKCLEIPKFVHWIKVLENKTPYGWFEYFSNGDFEKGKSVFLGRTKGSAFQYLQYFPNDRKLQGLCKKYKGDI